MEASSVPVKTTKPKAVRAPKVKKVYTEESKEIVTPLIEVAALEVIV